MDIKIEIAISLFLISISVATTLKYIRKVSMYIVISLWAITFTWFVYLLYLYKVSLFIDIPLWIIISLSYICLMIKKYYKTNKTTANNNQSALEINNEDKKVYQEIVENILIPLRDNTVDGVTIYFHTGINPIISNIDKCIKNYSEKSKQISSDWLNVWYWGKIKTDNESIIYNSLPIKLLKAIEEFNDSYWKYSDKYKTIINKYKDNMDKFYLEQKDKNILSLLLKVKQRAEQLEILLTENIRSFDFFNKMKG